MSNRVPKSLEIHFMGKRLSGLVAATFWISPDHRFFCQFLGEGETKPVIVPQPVPPDFSLLTYGEDGPRWAKTDERGDPFTMLTAGELKRLKMPADSSHDNLAFMAYVNALPDDGIFVLWWH
jgi:hypothetical protein